MYLGHTYFSEILRYIDGSPWTGQEDGQEIAHGHGQQHGVGRRPHGALAQHYDDEGVGHEGDEHEEGHHPAVHRAHQLQRPQPGGGVHLGSWLGAKILHCLTILTR